MSQDDWEFDFELKVWGAVRLIQQSIPEMRKVGGGRIINVTNLGGRTPGANSMPTSISRAAGIAITKGLSKDLAQDNILVSTVCIGLIKSGQHRRRYEARLQTDPGLGEDVFYDQLAQGRSVPIGTHGRGRRGRRRHRLPGLGAGQLPHRHRRQHRRRRVGSSLAQVTCNAQNGNLTQREPNLLHSRAGGNPSPWASFTPGGRQEDTWLTGSF